MWKFVILSLFVVVGSLFFVPIFEIPTMYLIFMIAAIILLWIVVIRYSKTELERELENVDDMDGREFELFLGQLFESLGYAVKVTQASRDFGADLLLEDEAGHKIAIQAKRYDQAVGIDAVQQIAAAVPYYAVHEGWVITNSTFTSSARELAKPNRVRLISRDELALFLQEAGYKH